MTTRLNTRAGSTVDAVDMFCGFGGSSQGIHRAGATVRVAANHNQHAVDVHAANFPETDHHIADMLDSEHPSYMDPKDLPPARFLWASPSCRHHSPANAKKLYRAERARNLLDLIEQAEGDDLYALSERSRVTMSCPLRYADRHLPEVVVIENVVEVAHWGPDRDGSTFQWWLREWEALGYDHECLFFNSMFFGVPQSRDRMFIVLWRKGNRRPDLEHRIPIDCPTCGDSQAIQKWKPRKGSWPLPRWGKYRTQYTYACESCGLEVAPTVPGAWTAIDWSDLGPTIGERAKPLAPKTIDRIRRGFEKFQGAPSIIIPAAGNTFEHPGQVRARPVDEPLWSQTGTLQHGVATRPFLIEMRGGGSVKAGQHDVTEPMHTITAGGFHHGLVTPLFTKLNGGPTATTWHPISDRLNTITSRDTTGMMSMLLHPNGDTTSVADPHRTMVTTTKSGMATTQPGPVDLDSVHFRMLKPDPELRAAMAFAQDFELFGTKTQMTAGLGNAVTPPVADWITQRVLDTLG